MAFNNFYEGDGGTGGSLGDAGIPAEELEAATMAVIAGTSESHSAAEVSRLREEIDIARTQELAANGYVEQIEARLKAVVPNQEEMLIQERDSLRTALQASQKHFARTCEAGLDASRTATSSVRRIVQELSAECRKSEKSSALHEDECKVLRQRVTEAADSTRKFQEELDTLKKQATRRQEEFSEREQAEHALLVSAEIEECEVETRELQAEIKAEQGRLQEEQAMENAALEECSTCASSAFALHRRAMTAELRQRVVRRESEEANKCIVDCQKRLSQEASRNELQAVRRQRWDGHLQSITNEASRHLGAARRLFMWGVAAAIFVEMGFRLAEMLGV